MSLVQRSRLGPSEKGSYIVTLACPLEGESEDEEQASLFNTQPTPFARRALSGLLRAVGTIALAAERDELDKAVEDAAEAKGSPLSANLCEALLLLRPEDDTGTVDLSVSWALTLACNEDIPQSIRLQRDTFDAIQSVARALRPAQDTETSLFVGTVDTLDGNPNEDDQVEGDVYLWLLCDDSTVRAKARLNADFYRRAITAHSQNHPVTVEGELVRGQRRHALRSVTSFELAGRTPKTDETTSRS